MRQLSVLLKNLYQRFRLIVTDALTTSTPSSSVSSASSTTTNQSESSTTTPASPKTTEHPETTKGVVLYVRLTLVVLVIVSSLSVLVFCRKRICKAKSEEPEPREETLCASAPEAEDDPSQHAYSEIAFVSVGSSHSGFHEIIVEDAPTTSKPKWTLQPYSTAVQSASTPPTPQSQSASLRSFTSSSSSPETPTHQQQTEGTAAPASGGPLLRGSELPVEAEYASVSKTNKPTQRSPAVEIPPVHAYAKYTKPKDDKSSDDYSLVGPVGTTAVRSQHKAADDSSELVYSELRFPVVTASSLNASSRVIYSMIQVEAKPKEY
ncbi:hypothetical protein CesoFtcFv8_011816 [Champsocephalus esox]|uniref:Uncharacterized protein n=1 Tax=Champsocephalus esox TaxID=159716 RepID=A0AAN8C0D1_9TELE|nr:hypothetical protein CesoFtcFv8_011816 [Champsocephalus esox]